MDIKMAFDTLCKKERHLARNLHIDDFIHEVVNWKIWFEFLNFWCYWTKHFNATFYSMIIIGWLGCWATRDEVVTQKPHKRKKDNFHSSPNTIPIIRKKRKFRFSWHQKINLMLLCFKAEKTSRENFCLKLLMTR